MTQEIKKNAKVLSKDTKTAIKSFVRLVEASALLTVAVYAGYSAHQHDYSGVGYKLLTVAAVLIGLRGAELFVRHLANK
jgi:hypothetical protein